MSYQDTSEVRNRIMDIKTEQHRLSKIISEIKEDLNYEMNQFKGLDIDLKRAEDELYRMNIHNKQFVKHRKEVLLQNVMFDRLPVDLYNQIMGEYIAAEEKDRMERGE